MLLMYAIVGELFVAFHNEHEDFFCSNLPHSTLFFVQQIYNSSQFKTFWIFIS